MCLYCVFQVQTSPADLSVMSGSPQRFQIISTEPSATPQHIQVTIPYIIDMLLLDVTATY